MQLKHQLRIFIGALCILLSLCAGGCGGMEKWEDFIGSFRDEKQGEVKEEEIISSAPKETAMESAVEMRQEIEDMEETYRNILEGCTAEFVGFHVPDETFLAWIASEYGKECVMELEQAVQSGSQDPKLWYEMTGNSIHVLWCLFCEKTGFQPYQLENVKWQECASPTEITLAFTGDINFAEEYVTTRHMERCENGIYDCFSEDLLELMNSMDIMMMNNEFAYSTRGEPLKGKAFTFRADPAKAELLHVFGTDIVNIANNHVYDYGPDALLDTIEALDREEIPHVGAGANLEEAQKPYYFICNGRKIAIAAATQIERSLNYTKEAGTDSPGVLKTLNPDKFVKVIQKAKENSDYVIAVVHWGTEGDSNYGRDQSSLAEAFTAAGADAVIGGHTHCLQGFEIMDGVPILYSLGNFWFSSSTMDTGIAKVTIDEEGELELSFIPCIQKNLRTELVKEESEKQRIFTFLQEHSAPGVVVTEEGVVQQEKIE